VHYGWLEAKFGVSWQVVPAVISELLQDKDAEKSGSVMKAMMQS
jgi:predicted 3-demethylubiquinone-9 3-methyltransferase (glyoxalase superfamily)